MISVDNLAFQREIAQQLKITYSEEWVLLKPFWQIPPILIVLIVKIVIPNITICLLMNTG